MAEEQKKGKSKSDRIIDTFAPGGSYILTQTAVLVFNYGWEKSLPLWVIWFPSIVLLTMLAGTLLILAIVLILQTIIE